AARTAVDTASSRSASANMMLAPLPPSSKETFLSVVAEAAMMALPVVVSPVNEIQSMPACRVRASPAPPPPKPWTTLKTPAGNPAALTISPSKVAVYGVHSAGLSTQLFPMARQGAIFQVARYRGRFQGVIKAATPTGSLTPRCRSVSLTVKHSSEYEAAK